MHYIQQGFLDSDRSKAFVHFSHRIVVLTLIAKDLRYIVNFDTLMKRGIRFCGGQYNFHLRHKCNSKLE